jgi:hypothetical protein
MLHTARLPFLAIALLGLVDKAKWPGLVLIERPSQDASWSRSPFRSFSIYATPAQLEQMRVTCEQIEHTGPQRAAHPEREILRGLQKAREVRVVPEEAWAALHTPEPRDEDVSLGNHDAQDTGPELLAPSALSPVWFSHLPDAVPDRAPLRAADPEAAWRGPLADDLLPVVQQWKRFREVRRQEQQEAGAAAAAPKSCLLLTNGRKGLFHQIFPARASSVIDRLQKLKGSAGSPIEAPFHVAKYIVGQSNAASSCKH